MRDEDGGVAGAVVDLAQPAAELAADLRVERAERLVEQQDARLDGERAGERHALPLAAGELTGKALLQAGELHEVEEVQHALADFRLGRAAAAGPHRQAEGDVVEHRHVAEQRVMLEYEADIALTQVEAERILLAEENASGGRLVEAGEDAQQRGLAGAGRAEQREKLARRHAQRNVVQRGRVAKSLHDVLDGDVDRRAERYGRFCRGRVDRFHGLDLSVGGWRRSRPA